MPTGFKLPTVTSQIVGVWTNPNNIKVEDDTVATIAIASKNVTDILEGQTFGFSTSIIPASATILKVELKCRASISSTTNAALGVNARVGSSDLTDHNTGWTGSLSTQTFDITAERSWVPADFRDGTLTVRCNAEQGNTANSRTYSFAYVEVQVTFATAQAMTATTVTSTATIAKPSVFGRAMTATASAATATLGAGLTLARSLVATAVSAIATITGLPLRVLFAETPDALNGASGDVEKNLWRLVSGTATYDTGQVIKSGIGSWKFSQTAGGNASLTAQLAAPLAGVGSIRTSQWMRADSALDDAANHQKLLIQVLKTDNATVVVEVVTHAGKLRLQNVGFTLDGSTSITANADHRISIVARIASTTDFDIKVYLDGSPTPEISATQANGTLLQTGMALVKWLVVAGGSMAGTQIVWLAHTYIDDGKLGSLLTDPGDIRVTAKRPNANGSANDFTTQIGSGGSGYGSGHSPQVNERPRLDTNGWESPITAGKKTEGYAIESASQGDVDITGLTIRGFFGWVRAKLLAGTAPTNTILVNGVAYPVTTTTTAALYTGNGVSLIAQNIMSGNLYPSATDTIGMEHTGTGAATDLYEAGIVIAYLASTSTTTNQSLTATAVTHTASMVRSVTKLITAGASAATASLVKVAQKALVATASAATATITAAITRVQSLTATAVTAAATIATASVFGASLVADAVTSAATLVLSTSKQLTADAVTSSATMVRSTAKALTATASAATATVVKAVQKSLTATASAATATLTAAAIYGVTLTADAVSAVATMTRETAKALTASTVTSAATIVRSVAKVLTTTASAATATMNRVSAKILTATSSATATLTAGAAHLQELATDAVSSIATMTRTTAKALIADASEALASLTAVATFARTFAASVTSSATIVRLTSFTLAAVSAAAATIRVVVSKSLSTASTATATMERIFALTVTLTADAVTSAATITRSTAKLLVADPVTAAASMVRLIAKRLTATAVSSAATMTRQTAKALTAASSSSATLLHGAQHALAFTVTAVTSAATLRVQVAKRMAATAITSTGSIVRTVAKRLTATVVGSTARITRMTSKALSASVTGTARITKRISIALVAGIVLSFAELTAAAHFAVRLTADVVGSVASILTELTHHAKRVKRYFGSIAVRAIGIAASVSLRAKEGTVTLREPDAAGGVTPKQTYSAKVTRRKP